MTLNSVAPSLEVLIQELRDELRAEVPLRVTARAVPVLRDHEGIPTRKDADEGGLGPPLSAAMWRYISSPDHWGLSRLGMLSIIEISERCSARHPDHRRPMFTRSLCGDLAFKAAYLGQSLEDIVWITGLSLEQVTGMLHWGLSHAREWRAAKFAQWSKMPGEAAPIPERRPIRPAA